MRRLLTGVAWPNRKISRLWLIHRQEFIMWRRGFSRWARGRVRAWGASAINAWWGLSGRHMIHLRDKTEPGLSGDVAAWRWRGETERVYGAEWTDDVSGACLC